MPEAYIIDAVRTPIGRKKGSLARLHPADLGAHPIKALMAKGSRSPASIRCATSPRRLSGAAPTPICSISAR